MVNRKNVTIKNCDVENYVYGIYFHSSESNMLLSNNIVLNSGDGVYFDSSSDYNSVLLNNIKLNNGAGLEMIGSSHGVISLNNISSNVISGISLSTSAKYNAIYNNLFENSINAIDKSYTTFWNVTKDCTQKNIIGGLCIGGNFWSDYNGTDTGGDGIGDTELPYNSSGNIQNGEDWLPLVYL